MIGVACWPFASFNSLGLCRIGTQILWGLSWLSHETNPSMFILEQFPNILGNCYFFFLVIAVNQVQNCSSVFPTEFELQEMGLALDLVLGLNTKLEPQEPPEQGRLWGNIKIFLLPLTIIKAICFLESCPRYCNRLGNGCLVCLQLFSLAFAVWT